MGLFFHDADSQYSECGTRGWPGCSNSRKPILLRAKFYETDHKNSITNLKEFCFNEEEVFLFHKGETKSMKLCHTAVE